MVFVSGLGLGLGLGVNIRTRIVVQSRSKTGLHACFSIVSGLCTCSIPHMSNRAAEMINQTYRFWIHLEHSHTVTPHFNHFSPPSLSLHLDFLFHIVAHPLNDYWMQIDFNIAAGYLLWRHHHFRVNKHSRACVWFTQYKSSNVWYTQGDRS